MIYPFVNDWEKVNKKKIKYEERKSRIFMRGIKIGVKRSSSVDKGMSMFEQSGKRDSAAEASQLKTEKEVKVKFTDEILGL
jgi:hypothetical protein